VNSVHLPAPECLSQRTRKSTGRNDREIARASSYDCANKCSISRLVQTQALTGSLSTMTVQSGDLDRYKALVGVRFVPYE